MTVAALLFFWGVRFNTPSQEAHPVRGIDVSAHQGTSDWQAVAAAGYRFVIGKAAEGGDWRDSRFAAITANRDPPG